MFAQSNVIAGQGKLFYFYGLKTVQTWSSSFQTHSDFYVEAIFYCFSWFFLITIAYDFFHLSGHFTSMYNNNYTGKNEQFKQKCIRCSKKRSFPKFSITRLIEKIRISVKYYITLGDIRIS